MRHVLLTLILTTASLTGAAEITLRDEATAPSGELVRLGDVSTVVGEGAARLARVPLMPTPTPGGREFLSAQAIRDMLAAQGESPAEHRFVGAYFVRVAAEEPRAAAEEQLGWRPQTRTAETAFRVRTGGVGATEAPRRASSSRGYTTQDRRAVEAAVVEAVQAAIDRVTRSDDPSVARLAVRGVRLSATTIGEVAGRLDEPLTVQLPEAGLTSGERSLQLTVGTDVESYRVVADLVDQPMRLVATAPVSRGSMIVASMVRLEPTPIDEIGRPGAAGFTTVEEAIGREAKRRLRAGDVLSDTNTEPPLLVARGEEVTVSSGGGGVRVRVRAVARGPGRMGDLIAVETLDRGEQFMARVVGPRRLAVLAGGPPTDDFSYTGGLR